MWHIASTQCLLPRVCNESDTVYDLDGLWRILDFQISKAITRLEKKNSLCLRITDSKTFPHISFPLFSIAMTSASLFSTYGGGNEGRLSEVMWLHTKRKFKVQTPNIGLLTLCPPRTPPALTSSWLLRERAQKISAQITHVVIKKEELEHPRS